MAEKKTLEKLDFNLLEAKDGKLTIEHVNQNLETPKVYYDESVELEGTIQAPGNFVEKRTKSEFMTDDQYKSDRANIQYSYQNGYIKLQYDENKTINYHILGQLTKNPEIAALNINNGKKYQVQELAQHLRMKRFFFSDSEQHKRLMENIQMFKVDANKTIEAQNDNRGNAKELYEIKNTSNLDLSFDVFLPIYIGQPKKKFRVEIMYAVRERSIDVWLESPEIEEGLKADAQVIIDEQLKRFPKSYVLIEQ